MSKIKLILGASVLLFGASFSAQAINLTVADLPEVGTNHEVRVIAWSTPDSSTRSSSELTPVIGSFGHSVTEGPVTVEATYNITNNTTQAVFDISFSQIFGVQGAFASSRGAIKFALGEAVYYEYTGAYSGTSTDPLDRWGFGAGLDQYAPGPASAYRENDFGFASSISFAFDGVGEGTDNPNPGSTPYSLGSRSGVLQPGSYSLSYLADWWEEDGITTGGGFGNGFGSGSATGFVRLTLTPVELVTIDINPGSDPNSINPENQGKTPVAILGSTDFDATQVDASTVSFGPFRSAPAKGGHVEDVNGDGFMDIVFHFTTPEIGILCGDTEANLTGEIFAGTGFAGTDSVKTVGCKKAK